MIVFTNTRTEEIDSISLFSTQTFFQSYYNSLNSNQFYTTGPRGVVVSIGACGGLFLLEKEKARGQQKSEAFLRVKNFQFLTKRKLQRLRRSYVLGESLPRQGTKFLGAQKTKGFLLFGKKNQAFPEKNGKVPQIALRPSSNLGEGPLYFRGSK